MTAKVFKVATIVGARPQFIKLSPLSKALAQLRIQEILIHTGQHYDANMSDIFFREMEIPQAQYHLGVGSAAQGAQTGRMLEKIEEILGAEKPDLVIVVGDTNSTLAGALAAAKLQIPLAHVEAGLRSFNREMPEEINRVLTDHVSTLLFCPTALAKTNLKKEGIVKGVHICGDVMIDALMTVLPKARQRLILSNMNLKSGEYFLLTIHRPVNTDEKANLQAILKTVLRAPCPVIFPVHPRTRQVAGEVLQTLTGGAAEVRLIDPVGYLDMLALQENARMILTDSGGIQKEALYLEVPCVTLRTETEWKETLKGGWNRIVGANARAIEKAMRAKRPKGKPSKPYGSGQAALKIAQILKRFLAAHA